MRGDRLNDGVALGSTQVPHRSRYSSHLRLDLTLAFFRNAACGLRCVKACGSRAHQGAARSHSGAARRTAGHEFNASPTLGSSRRMLRKRRAAGALIFSYQVGEGTLRLTNP